MGALLHDKKTYLLSERYPSLNHDSYHRVKVQDDEVCLILASTEPYLVLAAVFG